MAFWSRSRAVSDSDPPRLRIGIPGPRSERLRSGSLRFVELVEAPAGVNLDGAGNNFVQTKLFTVQGKILDEANTPPAIEPSRATFLRSFNTSTGKFNASLNLWVDATRTATVEVTGLAQATANGPMTPDGTGSFYRRVALNANNSASLPQRAW